MENPFEIFDFKDETDWLNGRMNGIGGSDASAVVGMNPYKSNIDLFEEKTGRRIPEDISGKACVIYGKYAEQPIRELFKIDYPEYEVEHHEFRILRSIQHPFMQASLDGELTDQDGRRGILEIKTTNILQSMQKEKSFCMKHENEEETRHGNDDDTENSCSSCRITKCRSRSADRGRSGSGPGK